MLLEIDAEEPTLTEDETLEIELRLAPPPEFEAEELLVGVETRAGAELGVETRAGAELGVETRAGAELGVETRAGAE